jgi:hypothetical protein
MTKIYKVEAVMINMIISLVLLFYPIATPIANYVIYKHGFANSVRIANILQIIGGWIKLGITKRCNKICEN